MSIIEPFVAVEQIVEGGPGIPPYPWAISGNQISFDGAVLVPASVVGGSMGAGTINANAIFINGVQLGQHAVISVADAPPSLPVQGNLWFDSIGGQLYIYYNDGTSQQWVLATNLSATAAIPFSDSPPNNPVPGNLWFDTVKGQLYLYYDDGNTRQWIVALNQGGAYLPTTGGIMTGALILSQDPSASLGAATKHYVDSIVVSYLPTSGGTLTGPLFLASDPAAPLGAATKQYVDGRVGSIGAGYLPLTGGTLSGGLTLTPSGAATLTLNKSAGQFNSIFGQQAGLNRWNLQLGNNTVEGGSNTGSNLTLTGYQDNGTTTFTTLSCPRSTNVVTFTNAIVNGSDIRLKENVKTIENALEIVNDLKGRSFNRKGHDRKEIGFIAQEVEEILPQVVMKTEISVEQAGGDKEDNSHILGIQYGQITALLVEAIKELTERIKAIEGKFDD